MPAEPKLAQAMSVSALVDPCSDSGSTSHNGSRREQFVRDGAVVVPGLIEEHRCERLRNAIARCQDTPSRFYGVLSPEGDAKVDSDLFRWFDDPDIAAVTHHGSLPALGAELCGADKTVLIEDQWFCSEPGAVSRSPWHQDHPYYNLDRPFVTVWVTLDDVSADAALRVVLGSHATGVTYAPIEFSSSSTTIGSASQLEPVPDIDAQPDLFPLTTWDLRAGDAIAIDSRMLHSTGIREIADRPFRRLSTRYAHPDTRYLDLGEQAAVFWKMLPHGLTTGDLVAGEVFPLITP